MVFMFLRNSSFYIHPHCVCTEYIKYFRKQLSWLLSILLHEGLVSWCQATHIKKKIICNFPDDSFSLTPLVLFPRWSDMLPTLISYRLDLHISVCYPITFMNNVYWHIYHLPVKHSFQLHFLFVSLISWFLPLYQSYYFRIGEFVRNNA